MQAVMQLQHTDPPTSPSLTPPTLLDPSAPHQQQKGSASCEEEGENVGILEVSSLAAFKKKTKGNYPSCFQLIRLPPPAHKPTLQQLDSLSFPVLSHSLSSLLHCSQLLLESSPARLALSRSFDLPLLLRLLAHNYHPTAYHNFSHAFSVLLLLHQAYTRSSQLRAVLTQSQWFYAFLAALAHDLGHPATSNSFEIRKNSAAALESGNESVLEHLHLRNFWAILRSHPEADPLRDQEDAPQMKELITRLILATDVAKHFQGLQNLRKVQPSFDPPSGEQALCVAEQIFHGCDIGNPCLDYQSYLNWAALVAHEFNELAQLEDSEGMQVTAYLKYGGLAGFYQMQAGFCANLVLPLWLQLDTLLQLPEMRANVQNNMTLLTQDYHEEQEREQQRQRKKQEEWTHPQSELKLEPGQEKPPTHPSQFN